MKITHGRHYYKFHEVVEKLRQEDNSCFICGSTKNVKPHHITRVKESDKRYAAKSNVVLLCRYHHQKFHQLYGSGKGVNRHNFNIFIKKEHLREIKRLKKENQELQKYKENVITTVDSAIKHEKTQIGLNILRNLAENLGVEIE